MRATNVSVAFDDDILGITPDAPSDVVAASDMPVDEASIIPDPGTHPSVSPLTDFIYTNGNGYTIGAGTTLYSTTIDRILLGYHDLVTNNGTVWLDNTLGHAWLITGGQSQIVNNGFIYLRTTIQAELSPDLVSLTNTGSIYVVSDTGWARGVRSTYPCSVDNSGLIAVQSLGADPNYSFIWNATAIQVGATSTGVVNRVGGRILAEAPTLAIGIEYDGGFTTTPAITNAGLIEANATGADGTSIGIYVTQPGYSPAVIVNTGTIRADFAIYAVASQDTVVNPVEQVENRAGGVIEGIVSLGIGDDSFVNNGTVSGDVDMGAGADTFSGSGSVSGVVDMGFDNDSYTGSGGNDRAAGGRGDDTLNGAGGDDLLLGGFGNDILIGGAGNDGLIGEWGDDVIRTSGGDWVEGGSGNDRVELGDLGFRFAAGGVGTDTLVLPGANLVFDLSSALATGRLLSFEVIELQGSQRAVVRAGDAAALTEIATLRIDAGSSGGVTLVGGWAEQGMTQIGANTYRGFTLNDETIEVQQGAGVTIGAAPGNATGLDPIAGGAAAPQPGEAGGLDYSPTETFLQNFVLFADFTIDLAETFYSDGGALFRTSSYAQSQPTLTNNGHVYSVGDGYPSSLALDIGSADLVNHGTIDVAQLAPQGSVFYYPSFGVKIGGYASGNHFLNDGSISVYSVPGSAIGVSGGGTVHNSGSISAISEHSRAIGVNGFYGSDILSQAQTFFNTGDIYAEAGGTGQQNYSQGDGLVPVGYAATGAALYGSVVNAGTITAALGPSAAAGLTTVGLYVAYPYGPATRYGVTNSGHIQGMIAIAFATPSNGGTYDNYVVNTGQIDGDVLFQNGNDDFDSRNGVTNGTVYGLGGNDTLRGGVGNDTFYGGAGNDTLSGGGGIDHLYGDTGNDRLSVGAGGNGTTVDGGADSDTLVVTGAVTLGGLSGVEAIEFQSGGALTLTGAQFSTGLAPDATLIGTGALTINMGAGDFQLYLQQLVGGSDVTITVNGATDSEIIKGAIDAVNIINGGDGSDAIRGSTRADTLNGGNGNDKIEGGMGADILTGGAGADTFRYQSAGASTVAAPDKITDFVSGTDKLGFLLLDSDPATPGIQGFSYIDTQAFHHTGAAEIRYETAGADLTVQVDINGDGVADMAIILQDLGGTSLTSGDFLI